MRTSFEMQDTIIFLDFSHDEYAQVVRGVYSPRVTVLFAATLPELFKLIADKKNPYIVVAFPSKDSPEELLAQILKTTALAKHSFVFLGPGMQREETRIGKVIPHSITLDVPTSAADVLGAIEYLKNHPVGKTAPPQPRQKRVVRDVSSGKALSVPELCFSTLEKQGLRDVQLHCLTFLRGSNIPDFVTWDFLSDNQEVRQVAESLLTQLGKRNAGHIYRTASICSQLLTTLQMPKKNLEDAHDASVLYAWSFTENPRLLIADYLLPSRASSRREVAALIQKSAAMISEQLGMSSVEDIVSTMAKLLGDEYQVGDNPEGIISSAIITTDMVNRACWQNGHWSPRAINHLLRRFSAAEVPDIHPVVLGLILKMLSESLEGAGANYLRANAIRRNPSLQEVEDSMKQEVHSRAEQPTPLSKLKPGMQISRPILSFDGRVILVKDTVLDEDLIWRIWQLAAIRPMRSICVRME